MRWILLVLVLAGCASAPPTIQRVEIPVYTPCVKVVPERPAFEFDKLDASASDGRKIMALVRDWLRGRKYESQLEAAIAGCDGSESVPKPRTIAGVHAQ
ncbi:MAG: hypothetical protein K2X55_25410 [Burkholderiaceae bacterium]|nr:hypothetical protein [Burkholderiaceae bacterium]